MKRGRRWTYRRAGVDIAAGDELVERLRKKFPHIGDFAGLFPLKTRLGRNPLLVGCADGVGTKLNIAQALKVHDTVGIDLVAMNVNDLICSGARPLFFLDYFAAGRLDVDVADRVLGGIAVGCRQAGCVLLGGETAEMPGMYRPGEYDLAGFAVGILDASERVRNDRIRAGDVLLGLPSSGVHSNGFSLVRRLFRGADLKKWGKTLLTPTRIYVDDIGRVLKKYPGQINGIAHITGGGLPENVPRFLPKKCDAVLFRASWPLPEVFSEIQRRGRVEDPDMFRTFNMGLGMVLAVSPAAAVRVRKDLAPCFEVGRVSPGTGLVRFA
ncbi:MAG TPA: phosphoribosylformylglycinamidine cyclo-ligase [Elusimicrobiota bacterium]|nr:phosphoribosylformylglycinamidine cyclo-ligase [Elusimicrobiota bacterium]